MPQQFNARYRGGKYIMTVQLEVLSWEERGTHFVYSPALDLTGYGDTLQEARESFEYTIEETLTYMENKGTIFDELERLGWLVNRKKRKVQAPDEDSLKKDNKEFARIIKMPGLNKTTESRKFAFA